MTKKTKFLPLFALIALLATALFAAGSKTFKCKDGIACKGNAEVSKNGAICTACLKARYAIAQYEEEKKMK